ncbi:conjugal transfer protein [uncultured Levyella sp.]|uniref:conjugal transfer protein n=1 Tax=uncultured Levyella sp. TaxID=1715800 RepID=UPI00258F363A|nr:conjugal transfer protein [uncultured Levyella sp.]
MEIKKTELRKISREFRRLASEVINAHFREQKQFLIEFMDFINRTPLLKEYIDSVKKPLNDIAQNVKAVSESYGHQALNLGTNTLDRINIIYQAFECIIQEPSIEPYQLGWFYAASKHYQDMAQAFGDRLVYPFVSGIDSYIADISTDIGLDNESTFNITINGGQVNIANNSSIINARQEGASFDEVRALIQEIKQDVGQLPENQDRADMLATIDVIDGQILEKQPNKSILKTMLEKLVTLSNGVSASVTIIEGIKKIGSMLGILL